MKRLSFSEYLQSPADAWTCGEGWAHFCSTEPALAGAITWKTFQGDACEALLACADATRSAVKRCAALLDARQTTAIEAISFRIGSDYVIRNRKVLTKAVSKLAAVRPPGLAGASAEGFFRVVPAPYDLKVFHERDEALRWIGCSDLAREIDEIEEMAQTRASRTTLVSDLRKTLQEDLRDATVASAAARLKISPRSLQRGLQAEGTSFQRELSDVRLRHAQTLMLDTDMSLTEVAIEAGFASSATFSFVFRKRVGESPSGWRRKNR